jgi:DHA2 family multidrug resistance protein
MQALRALSTTIHQQAMVITYSECFWVLGVALLAMMPLILLLRPPPRGAPPPTDAH